MPGMGVSSRGSSRGSSWVMGPADEDEELVFDADLDEDEELDDLDDDLDEDEDDLDDDDDEDDDDLIDLDDEYDDGEEEDRPHPTRFDE